MIEKATVLVLGAGASKPYGYPTGFELRNTIAGSWPNRLEKVLERSSVEEDEKKDLIATASEMSNKFMRSLNQSIDLWLSRNAPFQGQGKLAIASFILDSEDDSKVLEAVRDGTHDWFSVLFARMTGNVGRLEDYVGIERNALAIVTFNYDRSLLVGRHSAYRRSPAGVANALTKMKKRVAVVKAM